MTGSSFCAEELKLQKNKANNKILFFRKYIVAKVINPQMLNDI